MDDLGQRLPLCCGATRTCPETLCLDIVLSAGGAAALPGGARPLIAPGVPPQAGEKIRIQEGI